MKSDRDIWTLKNSKLQTVTRKFMQKLTVYTETYCLCRKFTQKLTVYAENLSKN